MGLKLTFQDSRPTTNVNPTTNENIEESYGFPSGHTMSTVSFWGYQFLSVQDLENRKIKLTVQIITGLLLILIPISRLVLGVHDLEDIVGGYAISMALLTLYMVLEPKISQLDLSFGKKILFSVGGSLLLITISALILYWIHPEDNIEQIEELSQGAGLIPGLFLAFIIESEYIKYDSKKLESKQKWIAGILGVIIVVAFYFGLGELFGLFPDNLRYIHRGIRYFLIALIAGLGTPYSVKKIFKI